MAKKTTDHRTPRPAQHRSRRTSPKNPASPTPAAVFLTLAQIAQRYPAFTIRTLRHWIFFSADRPCSIRGKRTLLPGNGLAHAIVRIGRRIYLDEAAFLAWVRRSQAGTKPR